MSRVFLSRDLDTVATFWQIFRTDGVTLGFTSHNRDIWLGGILHRAAPGMIPSAVRRTADLEDDGTEIEGALSHHSISAADLSAGRFDGARISIGAVDWISFDHCLLYSGAIGTIGTDSNSFTAELRSAKADLETDPLGRTSPTCRARFCGVGCGLSAPRFTKRSTILSLDFEANGVRCDVAEADKFLDGELRFLTGPQAGFAFSVVAIEAGLLLLDRPLISGTVPGSAVLLREGCDHTIATCAARFDNAINFQGEPFLPGNDLLAQYPVPR